MPTAKPPIQSSPSGLMKSARHMLGRPFALLHLLRREGQPEPLVASEDRDSRRPSRMQRQKARPWRLGSRPSVQAMIWSSIAAHRRTGSRALSPTDRIVEDRGIGPASSHARKNGVQSIDRLQSFSCHRRYDGVPDIAGRRLARRVERKAVRAASSIVASSLGRSARAICGACHNRRPCRDERLALRVRNQRGDPDRAAASSTWITGP
jgi:hypothetical protein